MAAEVMFAVLISRSLTCWSRLPRQSRWRLTREACRVEC